MTEKRYPNHRIIEKNKFFVQKKFKFFGWQYVYVTNHNMLMLPFILSRTSAFIFIFTTVLHIFATLLGNFTINHLNLIIFESILLLTFLISIFSCPKKFETFNDAKNFIDSDILIKEAKQNDKIIKKLLKKREKEAKKNKPKIIHYLDIQTERLEKLKSL